MGSLRGKVIVIGITASIAAYKSLRIIKQLRSYGVVVKVIMTQNATQLVDPEKFELVSKQPVYLSLFTPNIDYRKFLARNEPIKHISLADEADLFLICPATANIIGKITNGIADDLLTTSVLATNAPVVLAPAMNVNMWAKEITQENVRKLQDRGYYIIQPEEGLLACGYRGVGKLAKNSQIVKIVISLVNRSSELARKKVVVTAGATSEFLDAIRYLTNPSSGKMGKALAEEAWLRGAEVALIRAAGAVKPIYSFKQLVFQTGADLWQKLKKQAENADIVIHTAAVTDFLPQKRIGNKVAGDTEWELKLRPASKFIMQLRKINKKAFIVGFKAEYKISKKKLLECAFQMLKRSKIDLVVANDVGKKDRGFAVDTNEVYLVDKKHSAKHLPFASKRRIASQIWNHILTNQ